MENDKMTATHESDAKKESGQTKKPFYKKWWFWLIIAIAVLALIGAIAGGTASGTDTDEGRPTVDSDADQDIDAPGNGGTTPPADQDIDAPGNDDATPPAEEAAIGDPVSNKAGIVFKVESVSDSTIAGEGYLTETTEINFVIVRITITNNGNKEYSANPYNFHLKKGSTEYSHHSTTYHYDNGMDVFDGINPGITKTLTIVFETPTRSTDEEYSLVCEGDSWFATDDVTIILK